MYLPAGISDGEDSDEFDSPYTTTRTSVSALNAVVDNRNDKESAVEAAAVSGDLATLRGILENGCNINIDLCLNGSWTALMHACFNVQYEIVQYLLNSGANPNAHYQSITPLLCICSYSGTSEETQLQCLRLLVEKGALINMGDRFGLTPLMKLVEFGRVAILEVLITLGANIEMRDSQGWTAIFWAVHYGNLDTVRLLAEKGARLEEVDKKGHGLPDLALTEYHQPVVEYLNSLMKTGDSDNAEKGQFLDDSKTWNDYFPGIVDNEPEYSADISTMLYAMNCGNLISLFKQKKLSLRTFLLLDEEEMKRIGIVLPYERKRIKMALFKFHQANWKVESVSGLKAISQPNFDIIESMNTLGSHMRQLYILEATIQYTITNFIKPTANTRPDGEIKGLEMVADLKDQIKEISGNLSHLKKEMKSLKIEIQKMQARNPPPIDLIRPQCRGHGQDFLGMRVSTLFLTGCIISIGFIIAKKFVFNK